MGEYINIFQELLENKQRTLVKALRRVLGL